MWSSFAGWAHPWNVYELRPGAGTAANSGRARAADTIFNQLEGDLVADNQLVERAERRVAAVKEHLAAVDVANETVTLAGVNANNPTAGRTATGRQWLIRFAGTGGRLGPLVHTIIMTQYGQAKPSSRECRRLNVSWTGHTRPLRVGDGCVSESYNAQRPKHGPDTDGLSKGWTTRARPVWPEN